MSGGNHTISVLLTKIYSTPHQRNWPGTSFPPPPQPSCPKGIVQSRNHPREGVNGWCYLSV